MKSALFVLAGLVTLVSACEARSAAAPPNLHDAMKNVVTVQTQVIWDVGNQAQDDHGSPGLRELSHAVLVSGAEGAPLTGTPRTSTPPACCCSRL